MIQSGKSSSHITNYSTPAAIQQMFPPLAPLDEEIDDQYADDPIPEEGEMEQEIDEEIEADDQEMEEERSEDSEPDSEDYDFVEEEDIEGKTKVIYTLSQPARCIPI